MKTTIIFIKMTISMKKKEEGVMNKSIYKSKKTYSEIAKSLWISHSMGVILTAVFFIVWMMALPDILNAATITVNTAVDELDEPDPNDYCSLREAILSANSDQAIGGCTTGSGSDSIIFDPDIPGPFTLSIPGRNEDECATGDLDITDDVTINGNELAETIIDGGDIDRVFHIRTNINVIIHKVTIKNGHVIGNGGGIKTGQSVTLTITDSTIKDNQALPNDVGKQGSGGGIVNEGRLTIKNSDIIDNTAHNDAGGINNKPGGNVTIKNSRIKNNTAYDDGGGIENERGQIDGVVVLGVMDIKEFSTVSGNVAPRGSGIDNEGTLTVTDSLIEANISTDDGGGLRNEQGDNEVCGAVLTVRNSTIRNNEAENRGGGIRNEVDCVANIENSILSGNNVIGYDPSDGGGGINNEGYLTINKSFIDGNHSNDDGGGINNEKGGNENCRANLTVRNSTIRNNTTKDKGGGIRNESGCETRIEYSTISQNSVTDDNARDGGGGIHNSGDLELVDSTIGKNISTRDGGGIRNKGQVIIINSTISENECDDDGGGVWTDTDASMTLINTILAENTATDKGPDCKGTIKLEGNNIIGTLGNMGDCVITERLEPYKKIICNDEDPEKCPGLHAYADADVPGHGHFPLLKSSWAIDAGNNYAGSDSDRDQVGHYRFQDGNKDGNKKDGDPAVLDPTIDIGAVEFSVTADLALYDQPTGTWYFYSIECDDYWNQQFGWGAADPVPADYDGDGITDKAVYHPAAGMWYIKQSTDSVTISQQFGWAAAVPVPADYDGDKKADLAVYHPAAGMWYILQSRDGFVS